LINPVSTEDKDHILRHTSSLWEELRNNKLFVTGGTGFFGSWLLESFAFSNRELNLNAKLTVLSRDPGNFRSKAPHLFNDPSISFHQGDIRTFEFPKGEFPYVIHAAAETRILTNNENSLLAFDTIVNGTRHLLDFAQSHGTKNLVLISSGAVYGTQPPSLSHIPENHTGAPNPLQIGSVYGEGKRAAELLCHIYSMKYDLQIKIARCFAFVGPHLPLNAHFAIGNFIMDAINGRPILVKGDGSPLRSYLYASDLAIWIWKILIKGEPGQVYNVGSGQAISIKSLAYKISQMVTPPVPINIQVPVQSTGKPQRYVPSIKKAEKELDLKVWVNLAEGILKTINWYKTIRDDFHKTG
jgi:nucleoside-diphosphate-sugar epimerase